MFVNPFLKKFPEEEELWTINQQRIKGFLKFTKNHEKNSASSIDIKAAKHIERLNDIGFITVDSQEGLLEKGENPKYVWGENKGKPIINKEGSPAMFYINSERAYCEGFIRKELLEIFEKELKKCNPDITVLRYPREGNRIVLTHEYLKYEDGSEYNNNFTKSPNIVEDEIESYAKFILEDDGYYIGEPLPPMPLNLSKWTLVIAIDMEYGHHALDKNGLFTCLERALIASLQSGGSRKRRTMKKRVKSLRNNKA